jgi:hypothetical protein
MAIRRYIEDCAVFEPEALCALSRAFDQTCVELKIGPTDSHGRELVAVRIIELARHGMTECDALCERVMSEAHTDAA